MSNTATQITQCSNTITSKFTEEFEKYLKKQSLKATFNGCDIETFSWYKKMLGIGCQIIISSKLKENPKDSPPMIIPIKS